MEKVFCMNCGRELNEYVGRAAPKEWYAESGFTHYCIDCQQMYYDSLSKVSTPSLAFFYCCIAFNVPFDMNAVPRDETPKSPWIEYLDNLRRKKLGTSKEGEALGFLDGLTDICKIFGTDLKKGEFSKIVGMERSAREKKVGTVRQREDWGMRSDKQPYTQEDYDEMDRIYKALSADLISQGGLSSKQEYILRDCTKLELEKQKYIKAGNVNMAQKLNSMIQTNLASENLRKKDEKPIDDIRIDSLVDALEKKGYMKSGKLLPYPQLLEKLRGDTPKYPYTLDAADQMLLKIINAGRANDGIAELVELPDDMRLEDEAGEFAEIPSEREKLAYERLGLVRMPPKAGDQK